MPDQAHFVQSLYKLMALMGIDPSRIKTNIDHEDGDGHILMGMPDTKVGISTQGDHPASFTNDGWFVTPLSVSQMQTLDIVMDLTSSVTFEDKRRLSMVTTKQTSQHEQWLIDAVLKRGLPAPERNWRIDRDNGTELTTPDLAWPELRVAFFVDGLWWHVTKDDKETLDMLADTENREHLLTENRTRAERDMAIRSTMQADGWKVLSCSDRQLEDHRSIQEQVDLIERTLALASSERAAVSESGNDVASILGLLDIGD